MLEWKPPDPRIVDLVRRIQEAARRRFRHAAGSPKNCAAIDEELALDRELNDGGRDLRVPGGDPPNHDPDH